MIDLEKVRWDARGLVPVVAQHSDGRVLMLAYANREALEKTIETGFMHYWSRSRAALWQKGGTSGHLQRVRSLHLDCDGDAILARVQQTGPACHTGQATCFGNEPATILNELERVFRDRQANPKPDSYVNKLLGEPRRLRQKVGEEGVEVALAQGEAELSTEAADLVFHLLLALYQAGLDWSDVLAELERRRA